MAKNPTKSGGAKAPAKQTGTAPEVVAPGAIQQPAPVAAPAAPAPAPAAVAPAPAPAPAAAAAVVPAAGKTKEKKDDLRDAVFVKSVPVSIRRCGFRFDRDGCGIALDLLTDEQLEQLENDPDLIVERCQFPMNEGA